ncbi:MAG: peptide-methionine (S)-S-oxide reductase MsrA [Acidobacteriota bacterium]|nr:peptide-methionine (S)-S-oxide reductase MsrA [Acidobacteriota bacterium]
MKKASLGCVLALAAATAFGTADAAGARSAEAGARVQSTATATFAAGCFWCVEEAFDKVDGVLTTISGYTGGQTRNPTYAQVSSGGTGHTEALQVTYDPARVSYDQLLQTFWRNVDPTDAGGQFCDRGNQYRSGIFFHTAGQQKAATASKARAAAQLGTAIVTPIVEAGPFYAAEDEHQNYHARHSIKYRYYKWSCGRAQRLEKLWGAGALPPSSR